MDNKNRTNHSMDLTGLYLDFVDSFSKCMEEVLLTKQVGVSGSRKRPP